MDGYVIQVLWVIKSRPLLLLESCHISLFMHFNQLCSLIYYNLLFVNIMENHINLIIESISLYLVHIKSQYPKKKICGSPYVHSQIDILWNEIHGCLGHWIAVSFPAAASEHTPAADSLVLCISHWKEKKKTLVIKQNNCIFNYIMLLFSFYWSWCNLLCKYVKLYSYVYQCFPLLHLI